MTLRILTVNKMVLSTMTLSMMIPSVTKNATFSIMALNTVMLSAIYAKCRK
jgi:hypothetical protein